MFNVTYDDRAAMAHLDALPANVNASLQRKVNALRLMLEAKIKGEKLSGQVLNVRSGALRASIFSGMTTTPTSVEGFAASRGDVKYAAIHEFGGTTKPHDIVPVKAGALAFMVGGKQVFAKIVHHPGSKMPERSFMRSALADMKDQIVAEMTSAVAEGSRQ